MVPTPDLGTYPPGVQGDYYCPGFHSAFCILAQSMASSMKLWRCSGFPVSLGVGQLWPEGHLWLAAVSVNSAIGTQLRAYLFTVDGHFGNTMAELS